MNFLLNMGIFQPAMLVYQMFYILKSLSQFSCAVPVPIHQLSFRFQSNSSHERKSREQGGSDMAITAVQPGRQGNMFFSGRQKIPRLPFMGGKTWTNMNQNNTTKKRQKNITLTIRFSKGTLKSPDKNFSISFRHWSNLIVSIGCLSSHPCIYIYI